MFVGRARSFHSASASNPQQRPTHPGTNAPCHSPTHVSRRLPIERTLSVERPLRTRTKHTSEVLQNYDIVACRRPDGLYELRQFVDQELVMIRVRTFDRLEVA